MRLRTVLSIILSLTVVLGGAAIASGQELWATRYIDPTNTSDAIFSIVVDSAGNATISGSSSAPNLVFTTISYDPMGHQRWIQGFEGPGDADDEAIASAIDSKGNVYVTGYAYTGDTYGIDYVTIKYAPTGKPLWYRRYNGLANGDDVPTAIAVDKDGNCYVTGYSYGGDPPKGSSNDWATIKYDTNGNRLWVQRYNGPGNGMDFANAIGIDSQGNVYVAGSTSTAYPGVASDFQVIKYAPNGNVLWGRRLNWAGNGQNEVSYLAIDSEDSIILAGSVWGGSAAKNGSNWDFGIVKYTKDGTRKWGYRYNGTGNDKDIVFGVGVNAAKEVYLTGASLGKGTGVDFATLLFDTTGKLKWIQRWDGMAHLDDGPGAAVVDSAGNFVVTGYTTDTKNNNSVLTLKYDHTGKLIWTQVHPEPKAKAWSDIGNAITIDNKGNILVSGASNTDTTTGFVTIKYMP